jgi:small redox-active disulfide protein 2
LKVEVLGPGCAKCKMLYGEAAKAIASLGLETELVKVEKLEEIMAYHIMATPALVIDGQVKSAGRLPSAAEITSWLTTAVAKRT